MITSRAFKTNQPYDALLGRLSHQSVRKHFDAYDDIAWDTPEFHIDPADPIWQKHDDDPLGRTEWYRSLPEAQRARLGLHLTCTQMRTGVEFEGILSKGLLEFASTQTVGASEFRYAYHEVIEEAQHSLMFQEFINRAGLPVRGLTGWDLLTSRRVHKFGRTFPEFFFLFVLAGEVPIDYSQRSDLASGHPLHPLLRRIMQIHVTEEARHLCFAHNYLRQHVPKLSAYRKFILRVRAPFIFKVMSQLMLKPPKRIIREYSIPKSVIREAYTDNPVHRQHLQDGLASVRELCTELGIITPNFLRVWKRLGVWPKQPAGLLQSGS